MDEDKYLSELKKCTQKVLDSDAPRKLIVAGPGTGKTTFFKEVIEHYDGKKEDFLVITFINNLEAELKKDLGDIAKVFTFHSYCHYLLRMNINIRYSLQDNFEYYPPLIKLVKSDRGMLNKDGSPKFSKLMRSLSDNKELDFFLARGNYYNAIGYDDSVFRVYKSFNRGNNIKKRYKYIIVDEYQDFNSLETSVLLHIVKFNPTLIVGDDDQALYCKLRDSDPEFIRRLFDEEDFVNFKLPFCLRCPDAIIEVFSKIVTVAKEKSLLCRRIDKEFNFFPPFKGKDSKRYPNINLVLTSIQKKNRYYLNSITPILDKENYQYELGEVRSKMEINIEDGFKFLKKDKRSNLGWRIILEKTDTDFYKNKIANSIYKKIELIDLLPKKFVEKFILKANSFEEEEKEEVEEVKEFDKTKPIIKLTTFEGAKGLSAQHVFILGVQNSYLPKNPIAISDIEICKLLVALTRTRKQCHILSTYNFGGKKVEPSEFIKWLPQKYIFRKFINKDYRWI